MSKRKASSDKVSSTVESICIIHMKESNNEAFTHLFSVENPDFRFKTLCDIKTKRMLQPIGSHGYHRDCYQRFTMNLNRLTSPGKTVSLAEQRSRPTRRDSLVKDNILFTPDCVFCNNPNRKKVKCGGAWTTEGLSTFEYNTGNNIIKLAEERNDEDLLRRIRGFDLFACEAKNHRSCRMRYNDPGKWRSGNVDSRQKISSMEEEHEYCFEKVCEVIDKEILQEKKVLKLKDLRDKFVYFLSKTNYVNPNYRSENLKVRLLNSYSSKITFVPSDRIGGKLQSELVVSTSLDLSEAVRNGYLLGASDKVGETASYLRAIITETYACADELPWPPTASYLEGTNCVLPKEVRRFLLILFAGQNCETTSSKIERLIWSLGQDICRATTGGKWKLPKHISICMAFRHLFRSAQLSTLMNRLGHSESYSYALELETAIANSLQESSSFLTPQIIRHPSLPSVFHSDFDNFDKFVNNISGSGSIHTAHGIMMQDIDGSFDSEKIQTTLQTITKSGERSLRIISDGTLPPCYVNHTDCPKLITSKTVTRIDKKLIFNKSNRINQIWCLLRLICGTDEQAISGWSGFISETGVQPKRLTTIAYYPVVQHPITENPTVKECLRFSEEASREVGQKYIITTFDLGVCMKAYPIIWNSPKEYKNHIILIGSFHLMSAYIKMIGKKMTGSGLTEILLEAGIMSSGSMKGVTSGKNYTRAMHCHKSLMEGLERLLLQKYLSLRNQETFVSELPSSAVANLKELYKDRNEKNLDAVLCDNKINKWLSEYENFRQSVRSGKFGCTAQYWMSYLDHIWLLLALQQAVKNERL